MGWRLEGCGVGLGERFISSAIPSAVAGGAAHCSCECGLTSQQRDSAIQQGPLHLHVAGGPG